MSGKLIHKRKGECGTILLAVLAVLSILAITVTAVLIIGSWQSARCALVVDEVKAGYLAESGIHDALVNLAENSGRHSFSQEVSFDPSSRLTYSIQPWGVYLLVTSTGSTRRTSTTLRAQIGTSAPETFSRVITLMGKSYPLVISGATRIVGNIAITPAGVTSGEIRGRGFVGGPLVDGDIATIRPSEIPILDASVLGEFLDSLKTRRQRANVSDFSLAFRAPEELTGFVLGSSRDLLTRGDIDIDFSGASPADIPAFLYSEHLVRIAGESRLCNLVLCADSVHISDSAELDECIIVADKVVLDGNASFSGQIIALKFVLISGTSQLKQPAVVLLRGRTVEGETSGRVEVSTTGQCEAIFICGGSTDTINIDGTPQGNVGLFVSPASTVKGLIWWRGFVDMRGRFIGSAAVDLFCFEDPPTTYLNWLVDAQLRQCDPGTGFAFPMIVAGAVRPKLNPPVTERR